MSLFCGTNFSAEFGNTFIQSARVDKTKAKIENYYDFGVIADRDLFSFLQKHIRMNKKEQRNLEQFIYENDFKYFRRRLFTLALEELEKIKDERSNNDKKLVIAFKKSIETCLQYVCNVMVKKYFGNYTTVTPTEPEPFNTLQEGIKEALVNYIAHYKFPFLGSTFKIENNAVADALLYSAFSGPENYEDKCYSFSAKDFLGVECAFVLDMIINTKLYNKECQICNKEKEICY
ncbi:predicted protein [Naegleria gruberi]|uniref:Predicted protein n=1 Tax=Naegleria gruberi TaxID=5762 RepID=D2V088_NAEGR|nr:uncharacterized protein NAEGRDRAFT_62207 [Naegleria gruberi]EFC49484.1 predicted protein [Naegleria gruberi]|eukprot:XP_002682228.1 predicted protein [Naegleria gruberi strain NEG-M]